MKSILNILLYPIRKSRELFVFTTLMGIVILIASHICGTGYDAFLAILLGIFDCYLLCLACSLLKNVKLGWTIWTISTIVYASELFCVLFYNSVYTNRIFQLILETNKSESTEFLTSILKTWSLWITVICTGVTMAVSLKADRLWQRINPPARKYLLWPALAIVLWSGSREIKSYVKIERCFYTTDLASLGLKHYLPHLNTPFVRMFHGIAVNKVQSTQLDILAETVVGMPDVECEKECPLILLILGESQSKYHTQLYGYSLPDSPELTEMKRQGSLVTYSDAVTTSNLTSVVFRNMFSLWDEECEESWAHCTLFTSVFKKAGYDVYFLTNQFSMAGGDIWTEIGGTIFNRPGLSDLQFTWRNDTLVQYDGDLWKMMPDTSANFTKPTLLIVHLMGSHVEYASRYPESFDHFQASDIAPGFGGTTGQTISAQYANATLYNDYVVSRIWDKVKDRDVIGIYLSDHGEEIYDWRNFYERTDESKMTPEVAKYQFEIPFMFMMSDEFMNNHDSIAQSIIRCQDRPFINRDIKHVLFGLAGMKDYYKPQYDILSPDYDLDRKRIIGNNVDYDTFLKGF